jgi:hypothetical protein
VSNTLAKGPTAPPPMWPSWAPPVGKEKGKRRPPQQQPKIIQGMPPATHQYTDDTHTYIMPQPAGAKGQPTGKAKGKSKGMSKSWIPSLPVVPETIEAKRRCVHIHWDVRPQYGVQFFVDRHSPVGDLKHQIGKWYGFNVSTFKLHHGSTGACLAENIPWKEFGDFDIEVTLKHNTQVLGTKVYQ